MKSKEEKNVKEEIACMKKKIYLERKKIRGKTTNIIDMREIKEYIIFSTFRGMFA